jgi:hypothetical protein
LEGTVLIFYLEHFLFLRTLLNTALSAATQILYFFFLKVGGRMPLFLFIFCFHNLQYRHTFNPIHTIHLSVAVRRGLSPSPHRFVSSVGKTVPVVPSRESNSGLPYSKPTRYQLSNAAPSEQRRTISEQRRTMLSNAAPY